MSVYRCPVCGSPRLFRDNQKSGFSYGKAAAGVAVFGVVGAVAGLAGKNTAVYKCPDCGHSTSAPMDYETQAKIDACVRSDGMRKQMGWQYLKSKYPNIESGFGDITEAQKKSDLMEAVKMVTDEANAEYDRLKTLTPEELDEDERAVKAKKQVIDASLKAEAERIISEAKKEFAPKQQALLEKETERKSKLEAEIDEIRQKMSAGRAVKKKKAGIYLFFALAVPAAMIALLYWFHTSPRFYDYHVRDPAVYTTWSVGLTAFFFLLICPLVNAHKVKKAKANAEALEKPLAEKEKQLEQLSERIRKITEDPQSVWEIKLPEEKELVKKLRREQTLPVCVPAKIRLLEKWPAEYDYEFRRETDGSIMADLLLRVFQAYGGEIRQKKIKELLETTIPEALHEVRLKSNSKYALSSCFKEVEPRLQRRSESVKGLAGSDYDLYFNGSTTWVYYSLK